MDLFFDVESLRSGENWEKTLFHEIEKRDVLYLCWSHNAKESEWVDREWRYAYSQKGIDGIEPMPIELPEECPPPQELSGKHWNDKLLYLIGHLNKNRQKNNLKALRQTGTTVGAEGLALKDAGQKRAKENKSLALFLMRLFVFIGF